MQPKNNQYADNSRVDLRRLQEWCSIPADRLPTHPGLRVRYRQVADSETLGSLIAHELVEIIEENNRRK